MAPNPDHYAIVIGIDIYPQLRPLTSAVADATRFAEWLTNANGGGLPSENMMLIISPQQMPTQPAYAAPTQYHIDDALLKLGVGKRERIGKRLYFYFAGRAVGSGFDDVAMLMAPASPSQLNYNIGLRSYRRFFRETGLFDEVVFILDCSRETVPTPVNYAEPSFTLPSKPESNVSDFILLASSGGEFAFQITDPDTGEKRGLLTRAILEGLTGKAADHWGCITSASLCSYVQGRITELTQNVSLQQSPEFILPNKETKLTLNVSLQQSPEFILPNSEIVFAENKFNEEDKGEIIVELPHWSAAVIIQDNFLTPVPGLSPVTEDQENPETYIVKCSLLQGIYSVEVTLEGKSEIQLTSIVPNRVTRIPKNSWKTLKFTSPTPLPVTSQKSRSLVMDDFLESISLSDDSPKSRTQMQTDKAVEYSRKITWHDSPGGANRQSRLFLFVRTSEPKRYGLFHSGLCLKRLHEEIDAGGHIKYSEEIITDFTGADVVEIDKDNGWMAFCADLEPGFYILQKHRPPHIRLRQQPVHLCPGWETQIFLSARNSPSLRKVTLNMARLNAGFNPSDETTEAVEAVLDSMRHGKSRRLVRREKITALLQGEEKNPWLGILAAYALRPRSPEETENQGLFDEVTNFLQAEIGSHPDVRALCLKNDSHAEEVFKEPPLLRAGFKIVKRHNLEVKEIIPSGSLNDRLVGKVLMDSPWTSWRDLDLTLPVEENFLHTQVVPQMLIEITSYLQSVSPKAPVIRLIESPPVTIARDGESGVLNAESNPGSVFTCHEASLIKVMQDLTQTGDLDALPEIYSVDLTKDFDKLLDKVNPKEISAASGLPLSRAEEGLQHLREKQKNIITPVFTAEARQTPIENLVLEYALKESGRTHQAAAGTQKASAAPGDTVSDLESAIMEELPVTIEECVAKIKAEAARLVTHQPTTKKSVSGKGRQANKQYREKAKAIAQYLLNIVDYLLKEAAFTAMTDSQARITYGNGAFVELVSPRDLSLSEEQQKRKREKNIQLLGAAFAAAPLGQSTLPNPIPKSIYREFKLQRSEIRDEATQTVQAYLIVLRVKDASSTSADKLRKINSLLSELRLYASLFAHGTFENRDEYVQNLVGLVRQFQQIINETATKSGDDNATDLFPPNAFMESILNEPASDMPQEAELTQAEGTLYGREFWGISRHELIAGAAMELLSNRARLEVRRILAPIGVLGLEDVAGWADRLKGGISNPDAETVAFLNDNRNNTHGTWHFVNVPHGADGYSRTDYPQFTRDDDVVQMIKHSVLVLKGESDRFSELNALRWLAHLVGDVHQPVHIGCGYIDESTNPPRLVSDPEEAVGLNHDRGGNQIQLPVGATLHSYWDSRILDDADDHFDEADAPESDAAPAADAPVEDSDADPELKKRFIQKLVERIKNPALPEGDAPANEMASDTDGLAPEDWAEVWATESIRLARDAYQSLEITRKQGNKFKVGWEGKDAYDARCQPIAQQQVDAAARNLAAVLNAIWKDEG